MASKPTKEQVWRVTCHGCLSWATGSAGSRASALTQIEEWKSEHRLRPGCQASTMSDSVAAVSKETAQT